MKIAVASGKGGTGKTLVAVNLARVISGAIYVDCDVEEPNGHLFLQPKIDFTEQVNIFIPKVDEKLCTNCGKCMEVCQYNAIIAGKKIVIFPELCHGCGSCQRQCPAGAISEIPRSIGVIERGLSGEKVFLQGKLNIGEPMSPPVIRKLKTLLPKNGKIILDSPPGTACPMVATVKDADYVLLVTEPTPFGLHDLSIAVETLKRLKTDYFGVVINKSGTGDEMIENYCQENKITILNKIPHSLDIARLYAQGKLLTQERYVKYFTDIYNKIVWELS